MGDIKKYGIIFIVSIVVYGILSSLMMFGILNNYYIQIITFAGINIILAVSLNLIMGITGQFSLGHAGFMSIGGYISAIASINFGVPFLFALAIGGIAAALVGLAVGFPILRLKGDYLGITTLGLGEIIRVVFINIDFVGGSRGLTGIPKKTTFTIVYIIAIITVLVVVNLINSTHGRALKSIREDEIAAQSMGVNIVKSKILAFIIAALFAGVAGGLYAHYFMYINPKSFDFLKSIDIVVMVVMGGMGNIFGSIIAAIGLTILPEALRDFQDYRMVVYSLSLILIMLYKPSGLFGTKDLSITGVYSKISNMFLKVRRAKNGTSKN